MGNTTNISWTSRTQNFWQGCRKVNESCKFCYMYRDKERYGQDPQTVVRSKDATFYKPLVWHKQLEGHESMIDRLIFTNSWSDFFIKEADAWRADAWQVIKDTPRFTYQILTKRPENILDRLPSDWNGGYKNVWLGVSAGTNGQLRLLDDLANVKAQAGAGVLFVSFEPLLEKLTDLSGLNYKRLLPFDWAIIGGESGNDTGYYRYRPCELDWIEHLILQCPKSTKVFVKQTGTYLAKKLGLSDRHGTLISEFPEQIRLREMPKI